MTAAASHSHQRMCRRVQDEAPSITIPKVTLAKGQDRLAANSLLQDRFFRSLHKLVGQTGLELSFQTAVISAVADNLRLMVATFKVSIIVSMFLFNDDVTCKGYSRGQMCLLLLFSYFLDVLLSLPSYDAGRKTNGSCRHVDADQYL